MVTRACPHTPIVRQGRHPRPSQGWPWGAPGCTLTHRSPGPVGRPLLPCELLAGSHQPPPGPEHLQIAGPGGTSRSRRADTTFHSPAPARAQDEGENPRHEKTSRRAGCAHRRWGSALDSRVQHGTTRNTQGTHQPVRSPARAHTRTRPGTGRDLSTCRLPGPAPTAAASGGGGRAAHSPREDEARDNRP